MGWEESLRGAKVCLSKYTDFTMGNRKWMVLAKDQVVFGNM